MKFHIVGTPRCIALSQVNNVIGVGGDDGRYQIIKWADGRPKVVFNHKLKGPKRDSIIYRQAVCADGRFAAFSAMRKIFLVDVEKGEIIRELDVSKTPSMASECRFIGNDTLCYVNNSEWCAYDILHGELYTSPMPDVQEDCFDMSPHADGSRMVYQSGNYNHAAKISIFTLSDNKIHSSLGIPVPYTYIPGQGMGAKRVAFVNDTTLLVCMRKDVGITYYNYASGKEEAGIPYEELGFRSLIFGDDTRFSPDGRYVLVHTEKDMLKKYPEQVEKKTYDFMVNPDTDLGFVIYDLQGKQVIFSMDKISMQAAFSIPSNLFVHLGYETVNGKQKGFVGIYPIVKT